MHGADWLSEETSAKVLDVFRHCVLLEGDGSSGRLDMDSGVDSRLEGVSAANYVAAADWETLVDPGEYVFQSRRTLRCRLVSSDSGGLTLSSDLFFPKCPPAEVSMPVEYPLLTFPRTESTLLGRLQENSAHNGLDNPFPGPAAFPSPATEWRAARVERGDSRRLKGPQPEGARRS